MVAKALKEKKEKLAQNFSSGLLVALREVIQKFGDGGVGNSQAGPDEVKLLATLKRIIKRSEASPFFLLRRLKGVVQAADKNFQVDKKPKALKKKGSLDKPEHKERFETRKSSKEDSMESGAWVEVV